MRVKYHEELESTICMKTVLGPSNFSYRYKPLTTKVTEEKKSAKSRLLNRTFWIFFLFNAFCLYILLYKFFTI